MTSIAEQPTMSPKQRAASAGLFLRDVCVTFPGDVKALRGVTLEVARGSHVAVLGASGSGKSTLLSVLAGRLIPACGDVVSAKCVATIYQDLRLVKQKSAIQNVLHGALGRQGLVASLIRFPEQERIKAQQLLARVGLADKAEVRVGRLSGGEQQRVAIARALMQDPEVLLADEPVASLDPANAHAVMQLLSELQKERGLTMITVLHDRSLARRYSDRVIELRDGAIVADAAADALIDISGCHLVPSHDCAKQCVLPDNTLMQKSQKWGGGVILAALLVWALLTFDFSEGSTDGLAGRLVEFVGRLVPHSREQLANIDWGALAMSLVATFQMVLIGTAAAIVLSWPLSALAATNVGPRYVRGPIRLLLNMIRAVPSIIWALLFVCAVGLGPVAGVLALVAYSIGYLTKFFYEAFEAADPGPQGALKEIGASGPQCFLHAVWPASRAPVLSSCVFMLEYNVRAASVLGVVGAGGIGYDLKLHIEYGNYHVVGVIIIMLIVVVELMDRVSRYLRAKMVQG